MYGFHRRAGVDAHVPVGPRRRRGHLGEFPADHSARSAPRFRLRRVLQLLDPPDFVPEVHEPRDRGVHPSLRAPDLPAVPDAADGHLPIQLGASNLRVAFVEFVKFANFEEEDDVSVLALYGPVLSLRRRQFHVFWDGERAFVVLGVIWSAAVGVADEGGFEEPEPPLHILPFFLLR